MPIIPIALLVVVLGGLGFAFHQVTVPDGEYLRHLTVAEKASLTKGQSIIKIHRVPTDIRKLAYNEGPLRVVPLSDGKLRFIPFGHWQGFHKGVLNWEAERTNSYTSVTKSYNYEPGVVSELILEGPILIKGDTVKCTRIVYFNLLRPSDTLVVHHTFDYVKTYKKAKPAFWSYDLAGKQPVEQGWKFNRFP